MTHPSYASKRKWPSNPLLFVLVLLLRAVIGFLRALFFPPKPKKPIGYWARNERNLWELRVPAYGLDELPPKSR